MKRYRPNRTHPDNYLFTRELPGAPDQFVEAVQWQDPVTIEDIHDWGCRAETDEAGDLRIFVDGVNQPDDLVGSDLWIVCHPGDWLLRLPEAQAFYSYPSAEFEARYELCAEDESCPAPKANAG